MARHQHRFVDKEAVVTFQPVGPRDAAAYVAEMCEELSRLSHRSGHRFLHYLLEVAREEAVAQAANHDEDQEKLM